MHTQNNETNRLTLTPGTLIQSKISFEHDTNH